MSVRFAQKAGNISGSRKTHSAQLRHPCHTGFKPPFRCVNIEVLPCLNEPSPFSCWQHFISCLPSVEVPTQPNPTQPKLRNNIQAVKPILVSHSKYLRLQFISSRAQINQNSCQVKASNLKLAPRNDCCAAPHVRKIRPHVQ
jgi:hypothetical protein